MNFKTVRIGLALLFAAFVSGVKAQTLLPDISVAAEKGVNLVSWVCQYDGIKSIAVQRSGDSAYNYVTVGFVKNLKKGTQAFIDGHPAPGKNYYRLYILFNSDLSWYSNRIMIYVDSATLISQKIVLPPNDSLQKIITNNTTGGNDSLQKIIKKLSVKISVDDDVNPLTYIRSQYVFNNPLTGHVNMELPEVTAHKYSIKFYNTKEQEVMHIPQIRDPQVIIDRRNFQQKGMYKFMLKRDGIQFDTGYISIY